MKITLTLILSYLTSLQTHGYAFQYLISDRNGYGRRFDGIGAISGGGATSKLLINYPKIYRDEILDFLFKPNFAASLQILKVEIGGDSQSTDGTEASHMHEENDLNFNRGYEWFLMKEAKKRNPEILLYGLPWVFPGWLGGGKSNPYSNRTKLVKYITNWIIGAEKFHNLTIDFVGIWNERPYDILYIKMLRKRLDELGYQKTKIVAADGEWNILDDMLNDPELAQVVDVIGVHYPGFTGANPLKSLLTDKILWGSEEYSAENNLLGGGCWARVLNERYVQGSIAWNLIASYYPNLPYGRCSLMTASEPWSGHYEVNSPIWASAHHTQFTKPGWYFLRHSNGVGNLTGGGTYLSLTDEKHLTIIVETMDPQEFPCFYPMPKYPVASHQIASFKLSGKFKAITTLKVWQSDFTKDYKKEALFQRQNPIFIDSTSTFTLHLKRNTVVTLTTLSTGSKGFHKESPKSVPFPLPYFDSFDNYRDSEEPYNIAQQAGTFEVHFTDYENRKGVIQQMVVKPPVDTCLPFPMSRPVAVFGNYLWSDVQFAIDFLVPKNGSDGIVLGARVRDGGCNICYSPGTFVYINLKKKLITVAGNFSKNNRTYAEIPSDMLHFNQWLTVKIVLKVNAQNNEVIRNLKRENAEYQKNFSLVEGEHEKMKRKIAKLEELLKMRHVTAEAVKDLTNMSLASKCMIEQMLASLEKKLLNRHSSDSQNFPLKETQEKAFDTEFSRDENHLVIENRELQNSLKEKDEEITKLRKQLMDNHTQCSSVALGTFRQIKVQESFLTLQLQV
ncbi:DgyrCDS2270 [Dimorphilus gyrociliatus]|uniref:galactosylceramidase n=1 Tax=Dimorphilus gyrociliatus TaxID=2664684 RepID=A0A7I8V9S0_9ANNE|nr:DgyrCDS2270 [Dimorphilus gyrociliatus]